MTTVQQMLLALSLLYLAYLAVEAALAARHRRALKHVVHVNGIRGKSSVTRLIDAGLRAGGLRSFCKTTGTVPRVIDAQGRETDIRRLGRPNISEQLDVLGRAARQKAEVLVVECMAVEPRLQWVSQNRMLKADIAVITNVRPDHLDAMGGTLEEIAVALSSVIPKNGRLFTADERFFPFFEERCAAAGTRAEIILPGGDEPDFDFGENIALALAVCQAMGVERQTALAGMRNHYRPDPYKLSKHRMPSGALVAGGFSINDPVSIQTVYHALIKDSAFAGRRLTLLLNNRPDRGTRTLQHIKLVAELSPCRVWITGAGRRWAVRKLEKLVPGIEIKDFRNASLVPLDSLGGDDLLYCVGNIAGPGVAIMERIGHEGDAYVP